MNLSSFDSAVFFLLWLSMFVAIRLLLKGQTGLWSVQRPSLIGLWARCVPPDVSMWSRVLVEVKALSVKPWAAEPYLSSRQAVSDISLTSFSLWWSSFTTNIDLMRLSMSMAMHTTKNTPERRAESLWSFLFWSHLFETFMAFLRTFQRSEYLFYFVFFYMEHEF